MRQILNSLTFTLLTSYIFGQCTTPAYIDFGTNEWIVNVYNTNNIDNISASNYVGRYTQNLDITGNVGVFTQLQWALLNNARPSHAVAFNNTDGYGTAYNGCQLWDQNFSFIHKRKGFPPGNYEIYIDAWDDKTNVYLNNSLIQEMANYGTNTHAKRCIYLDQNSILELRTDNRGGGVSQLEVRIVPTTVELSITGNTLMECDNTQNLAVAATYYNPASSSNVNIANELSNITWTGNGITSGANSTSVTINVNNPTNVYTFNASFELCDLEVTKTITYDPPVPPTEFESNTWYVTAYTGTGDNNNQTLAGLKYHGFYRQNLNSPDNLGFESNLTTNNGWSSNRNPSESDDWQGCPLPSSNNFIYSHKRLGFPCGTYKVTIDKWDTYSRFYIDGVEVASEASKCIDNDCEAFYSETIELNQNSLLEFRTKHNNNNSIAKITIEPITSTNLALNNTQKTCPVRGNQWVDFYAHPDGRYLGSVRGTTPTSDLGLVTMTTYVDTENQIAVACDNPNHLTAVMQRHWVMTPTIDGEAAVRLPYSNAEFIALQTASNSTQNTEDNVIYPNQATVKMTKYEGPGEDDDVNNNCYGTVGLYESYNNNNASNPYFYQDFEIPGFSEFWLHGSMFISPLSSIIEELTINCDENGKSIEFTATLDANTDHLELASSFDGLDWTIFDAHQVKSTGTKKYQFYHPTSRDAYYKISTISKSGEKITREVTQKGCQTENQEQFMIYPNPATEQFTIQLPATSSNSVFIQVIDVTGKVIDQKDLQKNNISLQFDSSNYGKGTYLIELINKDGSKDIPQRLIIH